MEIALKRRNFLTLTGAMLAASAAPRLSIAAEGTSPSAAQTDVAGFRAARRLADLPFGRIAYVERGVAPKAALFLHGAPLNSFPRATRSNIQCRRQLILGHGGFHEQVACGRPNFLPTN